MNSRGYIAIDRRIFENRLFQHDLPFNRFQAWVWLIARAAWSPSIQRVKRGALGVGRGDLAATIRDLAKTWGWSPSAVHRFLGALKREKMVRIAVAETSGDTLRSKRGMVITICNYNKFQQSPKFVGDEAKHKPKREIQKTLLFAIPNRAQPPNQSKIDLGKDGEAKSEEGKKTKPRDGSLSRDGKMIWADHNGFYWAAYAADFKEKTGDEPKPNAWSESGRWFKRNGEGDVPVREVAFG